MRNYILIFALLTSFCQARFFMGISGGYLRGDSLFGSKETTQETVDSNIIVSGQNVAIQGQGITIQPTQNISIQEQSGKEEGSGFVAKLVLGTEHFPHTDYFGWRWELAGVYGSSFYIDSQSGQTLRSPLLAAEFISDTLINFYVNPKKFSFGIFVGVGIGWQFDLSNSPFKQKILAQDGIKADKDEFGPINFALRLGLTTLINDHHRLELYAQSSSMLSGEKYSLNVSRDKTTKVGSYTVLFSNMQTLVGYKYMF